MHFALPDLLCEEGLLSPIDIVKAIEHQVVSGGTIDTALLELGYVPEAQLIEAISRAAKLPALTPARPAESLPRATLAKWFPLAFVDKYRVLPIAQEGNIIRVAATVPVDRDALDELGITLSMSVEPMLVTENAFMFLRAELYAQEVPERHQQLHTHLQSGKGGAMQSAITAPPTRLETKEALRLIADGRDRNEVLVAACRALRGALNFCAVFVTRGNDLIGRMALGDDWCNAPLVGAIRVSLLAPSALSASVKGRAPYLGVLGGEPTTAQVLTALGRNVPVPGVLLPVRIGDRVLAVIMGDRAGKAITPELIAKMSPIIDAVAKRFEVLIRTSKREGGDITPLPVLNTALTRAAKKTDPPPVDVSGAMPVAIFDRDTGPVLDLDAIVRSALVGDEHADVSSQTLIDLGQKGIAALLTRYVSRLSHPQSAPPDRDPIAQRAAILLERFGEASLAPLAALMERPENLVRRHAAHLLRKLTAQFPKALESLEPLLYDQDGDLQKEAVAAVKSAAAGAERRTLLERLRAELPGPDVARQRAAIEVAGQLRDAPSIPRLIELVREQDTRLSDAAKAALALITAHDYGGNQRRWKTFWDRYRKNERSHWLLDALTDTDRDVRRRAEQELRLMLPHVADGGFRHDLPKAELKIAADRWAQSVRRANATNA